MASETPPKLAKTQWEDVAVAIKYNFHGSGETPQVIASGRGHLATRILDLARGHEIPIIEQRPLAESLAKIPVGTEIPEELWEAMAEVLAQIFQLESQKKT